jgi:hypothetical protein
MSCLICEQYENLKDFELKKILFSSYINLIITLIKYFKISRTMN